MKNNSNLVRSNRTARSLKQLAEDTRGQLVEYIIVVGAVALASVAAYSQFGGAVQQKVESMGTSVGSIGAAP